MNLATPPPKILYVDDDEDDRDFLDESLSFTGMPVYLVYASDGFEAIHYLETLKEKESLPSLIVMDLNMPKFDGKQTLSYLKTHSLFANIPVIILSTSGSNRDKEFCTSNGAVSYLKKPIHHKGYEAIVKSFVPYLAP